MKIFASRAWILRMVVDGEVREYCVDSSLSSIVSREWRIVALVYPRESCTTSEPRGVTVLEATMDPGELFNKLVEACSRAVEELRELRLSSRPSISLILHRRPSSLEEELYEVSNAVELCKLVLGEEFKPELKGFTQAYIVYAMGSRELRRVRSLARIDEGVRRLLESL